MVRLSLRLWNPRLFQVFSIIAWALFIPLMVSGFSTNQPEVLPYTESISRGNTFIPVLPSHLDLKDKTIVKESLIQIGANHEQLWFFDQRPADSGSLIVSVKMPGCRCFASVGIGHFLNPG